MTPPASAPVLSIRRLGVSFAGRPVLVEVSLDLHRGETVAVVGRSGSGKSTLVQAIAGLLPRAATWEAARFELRPPEGPPVDLRSAGEDAFAAIRGRRIGVVFQEPEASLDPLFRVGAQVAEVLRARGASRGEARRRALEALARAGLAPPARFARSYPSRLSGGENQRVCVAAALAAEPLILLADEPTSALDAGTEARILGLVRSLTRSASLATLLVTHDFDVVAKAADRVLVIANGRVVEEGGVGQILEAPREAATRELLAARLGGGGHLGG